MSRQNNKPTDGQPAKSRNITEARDKALITTDGCHTHSVYWGMRGPLRAVSFIFLDPKLSLWAVEAIFCFGSINQPVCSSRSLADLRVLDDERHKHGDAQEERGDAEAVCSVCCSCYFVGETTALTLLQQAKYCCKNEPINTQKLEISQDLALLSSEDRHGSLSN